MPAPAYVRYLLRVYAVLLATFTLFRLVLLGVVLRSWAAVHPPIAGVLQALFIGWRFDTSIACYLLALPFLLLSAAHALRLTSPWPLRLAHGLLGLISVPVLLILAADIPWFLHFFARLSTSALLWMNDGGYMFKLILQELAFWSYALVFIAACGAVLIALRWAKRKYEAESTADHARGRPLVTWSVFVLTGALMFLGIRGRIDEKQPIQPGLAYFCDDPFLNQLGLNAVFTFGASAEKHFTAARRHVDLMDEREALRLTAEQLHVAEAPSLASPVARSVVPAGPMDSLNVVIILMESMSTFKMGDYGGPQGLTPFLTELQRRSLNFTQCYSAGIHTFNGIYSTLYSFPALYDQQPMEDWLNKRHQGLGQVLRDHGYSTVFFTTHDPQFDNMAGFLQAHGIDRVVSEDDYPEEWVMSTNGVPDHRMFEFAVPELNKLAANGPFLSVFMTTSDHKPYILPDSLWFEPHSTELEDRIVEYCDRSVGRFFERASAQPWYRNTVFIVLGDHGINRGHTYDVPLSFHHTPLIIHVPGGQVAPGRHTSPCGQIDVAPTLLGMLNVPWTNTTLGLDVLRHPRESIAFCADDRIGCLDSAYYYIERPGGHRTLFRYAHLSPQDLSLERPDRVEALRRMAYSQMQATQWLVDHDQLAGEVTTPTP